MGEQSMLKAATLFVEQYEVHQGEAVTDHGHDFNGADAAFCDAVDAAKARGADPGCVRLVAVLATGE